MFSPNFKRNFSLCDKAHLFLNSVFVKNRFNDNRSMLDMQKS